MKRRKAATVRLSPPTRGRGSKLLLVRQRAGLSCRVAPHAGAWIETSTGPQSITPPLMSPPTRGRGSKHRTCANPDRLQIVAPHAGAWIETRTRGGGRPIGPVAPHAGAWIETTKRPVVLQRASGRPPRGGVDRNRHPQPARGTPIAVAPHAGAWIEKGRGCRTPPRQQMSPPTRGRGSKPAASCAALPATDRRPPRGGVDRNL